MAYLSIRAFVALALVGGTGGCAMPSFQGEPESIFRVVLPGRGGPKEVEPKAEPKSTDPKKGASDKVAAKTAPKRQAAAKGEAGCTNVEKCASVLKTLVASSDRSWMRQPAPPAVLANGVRLFAYKALRPSLSCSELAAALSEVGGAKRTFSAPVAGLEATQVERVRSLSTQVGSELQAERARRCQQPAKGSVG